MFIAEDELYRLPAHFLRLKPNRVSVCLWQHHLTASEIEDYARLHHPLVMERTSEYAGLKGKRFIERLTLAVLADKVFHPGVNIRHDSNGRPFVEGVSGVQPEISISHTAGTYALSLSDRRHGMDIEQWGTKALRIHERFLHTEECSLIPRLVADGTCCTEEQAATLLWSAKESIYKCLDAPGMDFRCDVRLGLSGIRGMLEAHTAFTDQSLHVEFFPYPACILTTCMR